VFHNVGRFRILEHKFPPALSHNAERAECRPRSMDSWRQQLASTVHRSEIWSAAV